jgi:phage terminase small subunit
LQPKAAKVAPKKREPQEVVDVFDENPDDGLTEQQRLFCQYYVRTFNATQSYLKAYPDCSYNTANANGPALLVKTRIRNEVARLKKIKSSALMIEGGDVIELMIRIAFADMNDYVEFGNRKTLMVRGGKIIKAKDLDPNAKKPDAPIEDFENFVKLCNSEVIDGQLIASVTEGRDGVSIKRIDGLKVLFWLADYFELNPMSKHKIAYDNARLELEQLRIEATQPPPASEQGGSNFIEALNTAAADVWNESDEKESNDEHNDKRDSEAGD